nr:MAG TPA: hypothetical protein [Caudoviricetes sp.]
MAFCWTGHFLFCCNVENSKSNTSNNVQPNNNDVGYIYTIFNYIYYCTTGSYILKSFRCWTVGLLDAMF